MGRRLSKLLPRFFCLTVAIAVWIDAASAEPAEPRDLDSAANAIYKELTGLDKARHREIRRTEGARRVTKTLDELKSKYDLTPRSHDCPVFFGQASVQMQFSGSGIFRKATLNEVAAMLKAGKLSPDEIPIGFIWVDGKRVTVSNRSLTVLYRAGMRPTKLIDQSGKLPLQGSESLEAVLRRLDAMAGKPSTEMLVRTAGLGSDGRPRQSIDWQAPIGDIVGMPEDLLAHAKICAKTAGK